MWNKILFYNWEIHDTNIFTQSIINNPWTRFKIIHNFKTNLCEQKYYAIKSKYNANVIEELTYHLFN